VGEEGHSIARGIHVGIVLKIFAIFNKFLATTISDP
jgi:hypothetical protein